MATKWEEEVDVGYCATCKQVHYLVNQLCWDCRKKIPCRHCGFVGTGHVHSKPEEN